MKRCSFKDCNTWGEYNGRCWHHRKNQKPPVKYYHVLTVDGVRLYATTDIDICRCDGSLHLSGIGCD